MYTSLWGKHLSEEKPVSLNTKELETSLVINRAALVSGAEAVISLEMAGQSYVLGTLQKDKKEHLNLEIRLWEIFEESYTISVTGKGAKVDLTGYFHPQEGLSDSGMASISSSGTSDDEVGSNVMIEEVSDEEEVDKAIVLSEKKALARMKGKGAKKKNKEKQDAKQDTKQEGKPPKTGFVFTKETKTETKLEKTETKPETKSKGGDSKPEAKLKKS